MRNTEVSKADLLETLQRNREKHARDYDEALAGWRATVKEVLSEKLALMQLGELEENVYVSLARPESHIVDYDRAAQMLEWEQRDNVMLDETLFRRYVLDEWDWRDHFDNVRSSYTVTS